MDIKEIREKLTRQGFEVESYKPGRDRLYKVNQVDKRTGSITKSISHFMTSAEFKAWYNGFTAQKNPRKK